MGIAAGTVAVSFGPSAETDHSQLRDHTFVAVVPPAAVVAPLTSAWQQWRAAYPGFTWVGPERWHVTLAFLGETTSGQRHRLDESVALLTAATAPLPARLSGTGAFPSAGRPRILWVGVAAAGLDVLAEGVRRAARHSRIALDDKPFRPHLTLARARGDTASSDVPHLLRKLSLAEGAAWEVSRIVLFVSSGGPHPAYTELTAWPLLGLVGDQEL
ncbi:MAG: RNA 2',3'-cyclic phosphodiesterase [Actinomycetota bacterium]